MTNDPDRANQDKPQSHQAQTDKGAVVHPGDCQGNTADAGAVNEVLKLRMLSSLMSLFPENQETTPKQ